MAHTRRTISIDEKIEAQKKAVIKAKERYDSELAELEALMEKRDEQRSKEIIKALSKSKHSYLELMDFLEGRNESDDD